MTANTPMDSALYAGRVAEYAADDQFIRRWSPRAMSGMALGVEELHQLFEAARWSPSCYNSQPWRFIYAINGSKFWAEMLGLLMDVNQAWAQHAGALVAVISKTKFEHNDQPAPTHSFDTGSAWMAMALQAQHMGLVSHAMWGFHHDQAPEVLGLDEDHVVQAMVAFGHPGNKLELPERYQEREEPSPRKPLAELVFEGRLG